MIVLNSPARGCSFRGASALAMLVVASGLAACASGSGATEPASVDERRAVVEQTAKQNPPQRAPSTDAAPTQGSGEVPPQIIAIFQDDLARRALVKPETITVVSATEQQWSDGAMGCPQPGQMYTQMIVPGYRVVLQAAGDKYSYHSDRRGNFVVCSNGLAFRPVKEQDKEPRPVK